MLPRSFFPDFVCKISLWFIYLFFGLNATFFFNFIFKLYITVILIGGKLLYNIVLVLPYIDMNPPRVYMCSQIGKKHLLLIVDSKLCKVKHEKLKLEKLGSFSIIFNFMHKYGHNQCLGSACDR